MYVLDKDILIHVGTVGPQERIVMIHKPTGLQIEWQGQRVSIRRHEICREKLDALVTERAAKASARLAKAKGRKA